MRAHSDILMCVREASRAAHRERDDAQEAYLAGRHILAGNSKIRKHEWYRLKDIGVVHLHQLGTLRYAGSTPQHLAIYEYGDGGMSCFHSTLHPSGIEKKKIEGHPEFLTVNAKDKIKGVSLERIKITLMSLSVDLSGYDRVAPPQRKREAVCYSCGYPGHIARDCDDDDWEDYDQI